MDAKKSLYVPLSAIVGMACLLTGCGRQATAAGAPTPATLLPMWSLGIVGAALGPGGIEGSYSGDGAALAIARVNAAGGIAWHGAHYRLAAAISGQSAVTDRVRDLLLRTPAPVALLGPDESDAVTAALPQLASARIPTLTLATVPTLADPTQPGASPTIFRVRPPLAAWASALLVYATANGPLAIAAVGDAYGSAGLAALLGSAPRGTPHVTLTPGMGGDPAAIAALLHTHPATIVCWADEADAADLLHALRTGGWSGHFLVSALDADLSALAGADAEGIIGPATWSPSASDAASAAFVAAYRTRYGTLPDEHAAALYDAVLLLAAALAQVGPDPAALSAYLATLPPTPGLAGTYRGTPSGDLLAAPQLMTVTGGQIVPLTP